MNPKAKRFLIICGVLYVFLIVAYILSFTKLGYGLTTLPKLRQNMIHTVNFTRESDQEPGLRGITAPDTAAALDAQMDDMEQQVVKQLGAADDILTLPDFFRFVNEAYINPAVFKKTALLNSTFMPKIDSNGEITSHPVRDAAGAAFFDEEKINGRIVWILKPGAHLNRTTLAALAFAGFPKADSREPNPAGTPNTAPLAFEIANCVAALSYPNRQLLLMEDISWTPPRGSTEQVIVYAQPREEHHLSADDVSIFMIDYYAYEKSDPSGIAQAFKGLHDAKKRTVRVRGNGNLVGLNLTLVFVALNFLLLVGILYGLLWDPIVKILDERATAIRKNIDDAKLQKEEAEALKKKYENLIDEAREEKNKIIDEGRREGQRERAAIIEQAREEAQQIRLRSQQDIQDDIRLARKQLQLETAGMVTQVSEKILRRELTDKDIDGLIHQFIEEIDGMAPSTEDTQPEV